MEDIVNSGRQFAFKPVDLFELTFVNLNVVAHVKEKVKDPRTGKTTKVKVDKGILNKCTGVFSPNTFTAIVGPSGCGKTTMLNLLSGRLLSKNLTLTGELYANQKPTNDLNEFGEKIGYVMQNDVLLATFTPRECFMFIANMRLINLTKQEKHLKVEELINILGLSKCADTYVGN